MFDQRRHVSSTFSGAVEIYIYKLYNVFFAIPSTTTKIVPPNNNQLVERGHLWVLLLLVLLSVTQSLERSPLGATIISPTVCDLEYREVTSGCYYY